MNFALALVYTGLFVVVMKNPIKRFPVIFYSIAVLLDMLLLLGHWIVLPLVLWKSVLVFVQRSLFAQALFTIVMFTGVLGNKSTIRGYLMSIRAELSIIGAILVSGHAATFVMIYFGRLFAGVTSLPTSTAVSFCISTILVVLLAVLTVTSFKAVKRRMRATNWKRVQSLAYVFFMLIYLHLLLVLLQPALAGGPSAILSIAVYTLLFLAYAVLRIRKAICDRADAGSPSGLLTPEK